MQWNATASGGGLAFPLQNLMAAYGPTEPINDWIFQKPGATIDTPTNLTAAQHLEQWVKAGYFPKDANAIEYTDANARFGKGEGVFMFNGDWQNAVYDKDLAGNVGFFVFPPGEAVGTLAAMSAPLTYGIANTRQERRLRRGVLQLGRHERDGSPDRRDRRRLEPRWSDRSSRPAGRRRLRDQRHIGCGRRRGQGQWRHGLHRQRHGRDLRAGLDT